MTRISIAAVVIILCASAFVLAQNQPNFSGTWIAVEPKDAAGQEQRVRHTATELVIEHDAGHGGQHNLVYKLDGNESRNELTGVKSVARATWEGETLVIAESATYEDGRKIDMRQAWSLGGDGRLSVDVTRTGPDGKPIKMTVISRKK